MALEKLKITKVDLDSETIGLYVNDDRVFHGSGTIGEDMLDGLVEGVLDAVGQKFDVVTKTIDGSTYSEVETDYIPESLREMKAALRDIERGTYRVDDEEGEDD